MHTTPAAPTASSSPSHAPDAGPQPAAPVDRLGAEVRESVLLLGLSVTVTVGFALAAQSVLSLLS